MTEPEEPAGSPERLVLFTDAVAAIAITLLVLPLLEKLADIEEGVTLPELIHQNLPGLAAFLLGFAVIFRFWWGHHRVFGHVSRLRPTVVYLSGLWTLAIVMLPIQTALITHFRASSGTVALYCGNLVLAVGSLAVLSIYVHRHPELSAGRTPLPRAEVVSILAVVVALLLALVIGTLFPRVNFWALLLMFGSGRALRLLPARWRGERPVA
jgi:uncharacterized membrane protein